MMLLSTLTYKSISLPPPSHHQFNHKPSTTTTPSGLKSFSELSAKKQGEAVMVSAKRLAQLAKKWQRMAAMGRKRLTQTTTVKRAAEECCAINSVAVKGHCMVYTADGRRFKVPLVYLDTVVFGELLRMSQEEFGFASGHDGRITLPCDAAMHFLKRDATAEVMMVLLSSIERPCCFDSGVVAPCVGLSQHLAVC
ncbi:auxin-responsive protein SAUR36-like [Aegilops tauschii subsp. strangulata]